LCNAGNVNPGLVGRAVARAALGSAPVAVSGGAAPSPPPETPVLGAADLAAIAGEYYSADAETTLRVAVDEGRLVLHRRPSFRVPLVPVETDVFRAGPLGRVRVIRGETGRVTQLSVQQARVYDLRFDRVR